MLRIYKFVKNCILNEKFSIKDPLNNLQLRIPVLESNVHLASADNVVLSTSSAILFTSANASVYSV